jgi:hypothetical protein
MKTIEDYKNETGLSYERIELILREKNGGRRCRTTIHKAVRNPWRTKWETFFAIADIVGMPEIEAREQWLAEKREFNEKKYLK